MKIFVKILSAFGIQIILSVFLVGTVFLQIKSIAESISNEIPEAIEVLNESNQLDFEANLIRYYDEILTQSARNYALTGDIIWKQRYLETEPALDSTIKEAINRNPEEIGAIFENINTSNLTLVTMEEEAIELADQGLLTEAIKILDSSEYIEQKLIYSSGINQFSEVNNIIDNSQNAITKIQSLAKATEEKTSQVLFYILSMISLFTFISFIIAISLSTAIASPIRKLKQASKNFSRGDFDLNLKINRNDEIGELAKTFVQMGTAIKESRTEIEGKVSEQTMDMKLQKDKLETQQIAILNILDDVELEKAKSDRLAEDLNKYKLAVDSASDQIIITDEKGVIVYANKTLEQITGYSIEEAVGTKAGKLWGGLMSSEFYENMWKIISDEKKPYQCELQNKRKDGSKYDAQLSIAPVLDSNSEVKFFVGIERDISKEKSIDRMKTEFISLASHQLRTPLSAMKWLAEMLLNNDAGELNDKQRELLTDINTSNERMISLVNSLLNIARIESGRIMVEPKPTNLKDLVDKILKEIRQAISAKKQKCNIEIDEAIKDINIDPNLIGEVFKNLITNANKYTPKSGEITIRITQDETNIICEVADNGYGIPKADLPSIFQKFFRSDNILEHDAEGTGLGLYLVKTIIESSEGEINIESAEGKGSKFIFTLLKAGMQKKSGDVTIS